MFPTGWSKKHKITIDADQVSGSANLTDFPMVLTENNFLSEIWGNTINGGDDLRFSSDVAGVTQLAFEVVSWDTTGKTGEVWVKIPTLSYNSDTDIYVWYGNSEATALAANDTYGSQNVWGANWKGVWHEQTSNVDSTSSNRDGTDTAVTYTTGKIKNGGSYNGSTSLSTISDTGLPSGSNARTFLAWVKIGTARSFAGIMGYGTASVNNASIFAMDTNGTKLQFGKYGVNATASNTALSPNTWYHVGFCVSGTTVTYYLNGAGDGSQTLADINTTIGGYGLLGRGYTGGQSWDGLLDDMMIYSGTLSADFIATLYNNQNSPSTFATPSSLFIPKIIFI